MPPTSTDYIRSDSLEVCGDIVLSAIHNFDGLNHKTKRAICKLCRLSESKNSFYDVLPQTSTIITTYKKRRCEHKSSPLENKRNYTPKNLCTRCGKGSIRGPLLFLLYINDMSAAVKCKLLLYPDDSVLLASGRGLVEIEATLSSEQESVNDWVINNTLSLHLGKTQ